MKWLLLAAGVFLFFNGMMSRTYSFPNESPPRHCFQMDYIHLYGCFGSTAMPTLIVWGTSLVGAALIVVSIIRSRRLPR